MIRFFDKTAFVIPMESFNRGNLLNFFLREGTDHIILVYDHNEYFGMISYESLLYRLGNEGINTEKYVLGRQRTQNIWEVLRRIFEISGVDLIPVFNEHKELNYFAYQDKSSVWDRYEQTAIIPLEEGKETFFIKEIWPNVKKVCIFDFNEFAYRFYNILKKKNILVEVVGEKWEFFLPDISHENKEALQQIPELERMNIYAEGTGLIGAYGNNIASNWAFLNEICYINKMYAVEKIRKYLGDRNILFFSAFFPLFKDLEFYTYEEYWRYAEFFVYGSNSIGSNHRFAKEQLRKVGGYESYESMLDDLSKNEHQMKTFGKQNTYYKKYGNGMYTVYLLGPCITISRSVPDEDSMGACLQREISKINKNYSVVCIFNSLETFHLLEEIVSNISLTEGDIVLFMDEEFKQNKDVVKYRKDIKLKSILDTRTSDWFYNEPIHTNQVGNREIAKVLVENYIATNLSLKPVSDSKLIQAGRSCLGEEAEKEVREYINAVKENDFAGRSVGAIVMNCNPMSKGHLYLIEEALKQVECLYIFVVEENRSEFTFEERFEMVKAATNKHRRIKTIPSGKFILSYMTMPIYFDKAKRQEEVLDASQDLEIFCDMIAPELNITVRFVGEEPNDKITKQYNDTMKRLLPHYHMRLVEIPRLEHGGVVISASLIRKYLKENRLMEIQELMPEEAFQVLLKRKVIE